MGFCFNQSSCPFGTDVTIVMHNVLWSSIHYKLNTSLYPYLIKTWKPHFSSNHNNRMTIFKWVMEVKFHPVSTWLVGLVMGHWFFQYVPFESASSVVHKASWYHWNKIHCYQLQSEHQNSLINSLAVCIPLNLYLTSYYTRKTSCVLSCNIFLPLQLWFT